MIRCLFYFIFDYLVVQNLNLEEYSIAFEFVEFIRFFHVSSIGFWLFRILFIHQGINNIRINNIRINNIRINNIRIINVNAFQQTNLDPEIVIRGNGNQTTEKRIFNLHLLGSNIQIIFIIISVNLMALIITAAIFFNTKECLRFYDIVNDFQS